MSPGDGRGGTARKQHRDPARQPRVVPAPPGRVASDGPAALRLRARPVRHEGGRGEGDRTDGDDARRAPSPDPRAAPGAGRTAVRRGAADARDGRAGPEPVGDAPDDERRERGGEPPRSGRPR